MTGAASRTNGLRNHCDPREGGCISEFVLQLFSTYHSFAWNVCLAQGANAAEQIVHNSSIRSAISLVSLQRSARRIATINPPSKWNVVHNLPR